MRAVDETISQGFRTLIELTAVVTMRLGAILLSTPSFILPGGLIAALAGCAGNFYLKAQLSVKKEMRCASDIDLYFLLTFFCCSDAHAYLLAHLATTIGGLGACFQVTFGGRAKQKSASIRAFGAGNASRLRYTKSVGEYIRLTQKSEDLNRQITIRINMLGAFFSTALASYLLYGPAAVGSAKIGFSLNMSLDFCAMILWWVQEFNMFQLQGHR